MDLFEYQGKQLFAEYGIPVSPGDVATTVDEAVAAADRVGYPVVVKAQVQVGGRGKAGGIKLASDADEVRTHALQHPRDGHQGPRRRARVDRAGERHRRGVLRVVHARPRPSCTSGMLSAQGGVEIEKVAEEKPEAIARLHVDPVDGLSEARAANGSIARA